MSYTQEQLGRIINEIGGDKVTLLCPRHNYAASKIPPKSSGCAECWRAYFWYDYATTPPHMRAERLDELEAVIHHAAEYERNGKFDFEPAAPGAETRIITDGFNDETGQYREDETGE